MSENSDTTRHDALENERVESAQAYNDRVVRQPDQAPDTNPYGSTSYDSTTHGNGAVVDTAGDERRSMLRDLQLARMSNRASTDWGLLILRIATVMLLLHGVHKAMAFAGFRQAVAGNAFGRLAPDIFSILVVAGQIALPLILLIGVFTRIGGLLLAVMMGFISFVYVLPNQGLINPDNGGFTFELGMLYALVGLALFFTGPGRFSIDHILFRKGRERRVEKRVERLG